MPDKSEGRPVEDWSSDDLLVNCFLKECCVLGKSVSEERLCLTSWGKLLVACPSGVEWPVPDKSVLVGWSVEGRMNGAEDLTAPTGGGWVGATLGAHFLSNSSILASTEDLEGLSTDLLGLSEDLQGLDFSELVFLSFFFLSDPELEPGDCKLPWSSTAPTTVTEDGSMREELCEFFCGVSPCFFCSRFPF